MMRRRCRQFRRQSGLSLVEAMMACLVVSVMVVSALGFVGGVARATKTNSERASASDLADGLIAEILTKAYTDPATPSGFGVEAGETTTNKSNYDDVDDYNGWTQSYTYTGRSAANDGLVASVVVTRAVLATPNSDSATETGLKHIKVTVKRQNRVLATREAWKADAL